MSYTRRKLPFAHIQIFTNGDFLSKELFDELVNRGVDDFCITQHSKLMPKKIKHFFNQLTINDWKKIQYRSIEEIQLSSREGLIPLKNLKKLEKCDFPSKTLIIDYKGRVILCCDDYLSNYSFGNINNEKLIDIWKKKEYTKVRRDLVNGIFRLNICTECGLGSLDINNTKIITAH